MLKVDRHRYVKVAYHGECGAPAHASRGVCSKCVPLFNRTWHFDAMQRVACAEDAFCFLRLCSYLDLRMRMLGLFQLPALQLSNVAPTPFTLHHIPRLTFSPQALSP